MESNPYQSPRSLHAPSEEVADDHRPSLLRCSLFGMISGAIIGATTAGAGMFMVGLVLAAPLHEAMIAMAVVGAYYGVVGGGFAGAVFGSPLAVLARLHKSKLGTLFHHACLLVFGLLFLVLGGSLGVTHGRMGVGGDQMSHDTFMIVLAVSLGLGLLAGIVAGLLFARRVAKFVSPDDSSPHRMRGRRFPTVGRH